MEPQFIITIAVAISALVAGVIKGFYFRMIPILFVLSIIAGRFAYPHEQEDAMWLIGAAIAAGLDLTAATVGLAVGALLYVLRQRLGWTFPSRKRP